MTSLENTSATDPTGGSVVTDQENIKVWDIAVRLFHWSMVGTFAFAWVTADEWDRPHEIAGYIVGGLIAFRLLWGLIGSKHARFSDFFTSPFTVLRYLAQEMGGKAKRYIGHNPAGGAMVIALLVSLTGITISGIAMVSDTFWGMDWVEEIHEFFAYFTLALIGLHIVGVIVASVQHRENLVKSMITGWKRNK